MAPRLREGLSVYLQGKIKQWNAEMSSVEKIFQKNIDRLRQIVRRLVVVEENMSKVMYVLSFLFRAMKRSVETQGIGADLIFTVFKEILIVCRSKLPMSTETQCMHDEQVWIGLGWIGLGWIGLDCCSVAYLLCANDSLSSSL
jgi:hypothetical protein